MINMILLKVRSSKVPLCTGEMVVEADPGQDMVEGHIDSLQSDGTALQVARL